ncbi:hypothetical protein [Chroogloeocystis siderophila]|jgi:hypothetical protein|uniref:Uncharacterized protein n=1 Tax=Chroogloeocystis siderophila 5.2 s.c.1 TaxID=247279 RepID=A0A1U7HN34_9CHRO|nr:hypothetical protein [Chroogloeocystis siderophila]OKH25010.1 hypothetical protein NIES1031_14260 [Chroogloeocystis siderophila 5.2 s.c.1]
MEFLRSLLLVLELRVTNLLDNLATNEIPRFIHLLPKFISYIFLSIREFARAMMAEEQDL